MANIQFNNKINQAFKTLIIVKSLLMKDEALTFNKIYNNAKAYGLDKQNLDNLEYLEFYFNTRLLVYLREKKLDFINFDELIKNPEYQEIFKNSTYTGRSDDLELCCDIRNCIGHNSFDNDFNSNNEMTILFDSSKNNKGSLTISAGNFKKYVNLLKEYIDPKLVEENNKIINNPDYIVEMINRADLLSLKSIITKFMNSSDSKEPKPTASRKLKRKLNSKKYQEDMKFLNNLFEGHTTLSSKDKNRLKKILNRYNILPQLDKAQNIKIRKILKNKTKDTDFIKKIKEYINTPFVDVGYNQMMTYDIINHMLNTEILKNKNSTYNEIFPDYIKKVNEEFKNNNIVNNSKYHIYKFTNDKKYVGQDVTNLMFFTFTNYFDQEKKDFLNKNQYKPNFKLHNIDNKDIDKKDIDEKDIDKKEIKLFNEKPADFLNLLRNSILHGDFIINEKPNITFNLYTPDKKKIMKEIKENIKSLQYNKMPKKKIFREKYTSNIYNYMMRASGGSKFTSITQKKEHITQITLSYEELFQINDYLTRTYPLFLASLDSSHSTTSDSSSQPALNKTQTSSKAIQPSSQDNNATQILEQEIESEL